eukprot:2831487-Pyramimonas_sp.AAC.1
MAARLPGYPATCLGRVTTAAKPHVWESPGIQPRVLGRGSLGAKTAAALAAVGVRWALSLFAHRK